MLNSNSDIIICKQVANNILHNFSMHMCWSFHCSFAIHASLICCAKKRKKKIPKCYLGGPMHFYSCFHENCTLNRLINARSIDRQVDRCRYRYLDTLISIF